MLGYIHNKNQFLDVGSDEKAQLRTLYRGFLERFQCVVRRCEDVTQFIGDIQVVFATHQANLARFLLDLTSKQATHSKFSPVCHEYSPALQLSMLHTSVTALANPILDVGCGSQGGLVAYLNRLGKTAFGIDRDASPQPQVMQVDWFDYPVGLQSWGTVISHMALSNHFLHHHISRHGQPERYATLYMAILRALQPLGQFLYTPGLPFMEDLLPPEHYTVERYLLPSVGGSSADQSLSAAYGRSVFYATQITRNL